MNAMCGILAAASILTATATAATAQTHSELLEKAIFTEETVGDLEGAARLYEQLVSTPSVSREIVAEARVRLADSRRRQEDRRRALATPQQAGTVIAFRPGSLPQSNADAVAAAGAHDHDNECCGTFTGNYDPTRMITVSGSVKAMEWLNPMVILTVAGTDGSNWGFTLPSPNRLMRGGLTRTTFKPGEEVVVTGYLATGRDSNCPTAQPSACSTLPGGALHASASLIVSADGRTLFDRKAPPRVDPPAVAAAPTAPNHPVNRAQVDRTRRQSEYYDPLQSVSIVGVVTQVQWADPAVIIFVDSADGFWGFTMNSPAEMSRMGWSRTDLKVGDRVRIAGSRARGIGSNCPGPLPNGCATLPNGALHAWAHAIGPAGENDRGEMRATPPAPGQAPTPWVFGGNYERPSATPPTVR